MFDAPVLEPDFDLFLGEAEVGGDLDAPQSRQVHIGAELPLQLQQLVAGERGPDPLRGVQLIRPVRRLGCNGYTQCQN